MTAEQHSIDITNMPELDRLATEVAETGIARALRRGDTVVATIVPVATPPTPQLPAKKNPKTALEAIEASAGGWKGLVDAEQLKKDIKEARGSRASAAMR
jgi:hypothetical protein